MPDLTQRLNSLLEKRPPVKTTFRHATCGQQTTIPTRLAATVHANPDAFPKLHCVGCVKEVPAGELAWL